MIISCPECAGPFEVTDDRIAALVQVACPHCSFRMILDFAAANDPGLVEQGMRMASGFRSAADYHASAGVASGPARLEPEPEAETEPVAVPRPLVAAAAIEETPLVTTPHIPPVRTRREPLAPATEAPRPIAAPGPEPLRPAASARAEPSDEARTEVHMLPRGAERVVPVDIPPVRRAPLARDEDDIAVHVPAPATEIVRAGPTPAPADELSIDFDEEDEAEPQTTVDVPPVREPAIVAPERATPTPQPVPTAAEHAAHPALGSDEDEDLPTMVVPSEARDAARREMEALAAARRASPPPPVREVEVDQTPSGRDRVPPHTPPGRAKVTPRPEDETTPPERRALQLGDETKPPKPVGELEPFDDEDEIERMSTFGVVMVLLLVLLAGGLVGASLALNEGYDPDPRPLLEKLYRQYIKGQ